MVAGAGVGVRDAVEAGRSAAVVDAPPDSPDFVAAFAAAIAAVLDDPARRSEMASAARRFARGRDLDSAAARLRAALAPLAQAA